MKPASHRPSDMPQREGLIPSDISFPVVGIGASAGGLQALQVFFEQMPADNGMAFVVVMHLSPKHDSIMDQIIQKSTKMIVTQVKSTCRIERNHVYVISPANRLAMNDGYLKVTPAERPVGDHVAIDLFFRDLAEVHKDHAFCLVLSGTGSDGAVGLTRIKEQGGVTLVQSPEDAEFDGMPLAAIDTRMVDFVLPVSDMPQKLIELWSNARNIKLPPYIDNDKEADTSIPDQAAAEQLIRDILGVLRVRTGHDFKHYKRATVLRRIERRMQVTTQPDLRAYLSYLEGHAEESKGLLADMLIGVTNFFRDREAFEALERHVFGDLMSNPHADAVGREEIRLWSAGCSTGEEAYGLSILAAEHQALTNSPSRVQVFATDIDERAIGRGRSGLYPESIVTDVPPTRLRQYFLKDQGNYRVRKEIRETVLFAKHNLLSDPPFSQIDLIVCRNLLIYLDREVQREILQMFHFALRPGGYLFLGSSEGADSCSDLFVPIDKRNRIYRSKASTSLNRRAFTVPRGGYVRNDVQKLPPLVHATRKVSFADVHHRALEAELPPSMIVDANADILYMNEGAGRFLRYVTGEVGRNVLALIMPALRLELRTTLFGAQQGGKPVTSRQVPFKDGEDEGVLHIKAKPFKDVKTDHDVVLLVFLLQQGEVRVGGAGSDPLTESQVLVSLEQELQRTKTQLQETIEQSEVSGEELKASNEEMQAVNEELRSATEELETSKEELQSINEELLTVNHELKNKVEETDKINDYLANLISSTDIATVFVDRKMRIRWFTPRATDIFSMLPSDTGRSLLDITHRLDYPTLAVDAADVFGSLNMIEREVRSTDQRWYIARLLPYRSSDSHIDGTVLTFIDITTRRAAEEDLRLGQERMRLAAESTHDFAIIVLDERGVITDWNTGAEIIFGYSKAEVTGKHYEIIFSPEDRSAGVPASELSSIRTVGRGEDERWHLRKDGSRFYCSGEMAVLQGDTVNGYVKIARDLTGHKRMHEEQSKKLEETRSSSNMKDEFFAVMSHELKHPLNLIQLNAEILRRLPAVRNAEVATKAVNTIGDAVASQARIIDDLLDVARIRTGKLKLKKQPIDLITVVRDIHAVAVSEYQDGHISLVLPSPSAAPLIVYGDSTRIEQVIWNLLNNALKFSSPDAQVRVELSQLDSHAQVIIRDNGIGMSPDDLENVFDLFKQASSHPAHQRDGLGIGLSLVRQLVQAHGGTVSATSQGIGRGCTFVVRLPLSDRYENLEDVSRETEQTQRLKGLDVLLVDDSVEVLEVMQMLLETEEAQVKAFNEPLKALETARDKRYDVIISDVGMPLMDGYELIQALRQLPHLKEVPAIALTGFGDSMHQHKSKEAGFDRILTKPVQYEDLIDTIERMCLNLRS